MKNMRWFKGSSRIKKKFAILPIRIDSEVRWLEIVYIYQKKDGYNFWCDIEFSTKQAYIERKAEEKEYLEMKGSDNK